VCTTLHAVSHVTGRNNTNVHQVDRRSGSENIVDDHRPWPLARLRTVWYGYPIHQTLNDTPNRANPSLTPHFATRPKKTDRTLKPHMHFSLSPAHDHPPKLHHTTRTSPALLLFPQTQKYTSASGQPLNKIPPAHPRHLSFPYPIFRCCRAMVQGHAIKRDKG
jgi:hypothetical protein